MTMLSHAIFVLILPLVSAAIIALFLRRSGGAAAAVSTLTAAAIAVISVMLALHNERFTESTEWMRLGVWWFPSASSLTISPRSCS